MKHLKWLVLALSASTLTLSAACGSASSDECGDGIVNGQEKCDDGNDIDDDACSNQCTLVLADANCGNGVVEAPEACDDGNIANGDGCENNCTKTLVLVPPPNCGNGEVEAGEACDDGNAVDTDACTQTCQLPACGDGLLQAANQEQCDDGNVAAGDGCSATCLLEEKTSSFLKANLNLAITDNAYDGSLASMDCVQINVPDNGFNTITDVQLRLGISHSYISDLIIKLRSPEGTLITVLNRPGFAEMADDGLGFGTESSNLSSVSYITFKNGGATDAEAMGKSLGDKQVVCKEDGLCEYAPNAGAAVPKGDFSAFSEESSIGNWDVCVGDADGGNAGTLQSVNLKLTQKLSL